MALINYTESRRKEGIYMKFERISENQIRCTLNKNDLLDRELRISELAYGTDKAKALFRDMMQQASYELGFEAEDIPLMIEAIPVSTECLVLIITKVEDPDELDTRFSKFSSDSTEEEYESEDYGDSYDDEFLNQIPGFTNDFEDITKDTIAAGEPAFVPLSEAIAPHNIMSEKTEKDTKNYPPAPACKTFSFQNLDTVIDLAKQLAPIYHGANTLYKDEDNNLYYLILSKDDHTLDEYHKICSHALEYGKLERTSYSSLAYYEEHFKMISQAKAIEVLAML